MSAGQMDLSTLPIPIQSESDYHKILHDLGIAMLVLELVADGEEPSADLRRLADNAYLRLSDWAKQLKRRRHSKAENSNYRLSQSAATVPTRADYELSEARS